MNNDEIRAQFLVDTNWGTYDGALTRAELGALLTEIAQLTVALAEERSLSAQLAGERDEAIELKEKRGKQIDTLAAALADMTAERDALSGRMTYECAAKNAFDIRFREENAKYNKAVVHLRRAREQRDALKAEIDATRRLNDELAESRHDWRIRALGAERERDAANKRADELGAEINRVAPFLATHGVSGYALERCGPDAQPIQTDAKPDQGGEDL